MKPITADEAAKRFCPYTFNGHRPADKCIAGLCMAWRVVHERASREDHSGGRDHMVSEGSKTRRIPRREGGPMSSGLWVLDAVGVCARLDADQS